MLTEVEKRGGKGFICGTPVISDGETMGWNGMKYSLVSRDWIADCVEMMAEAYAVVRSTCLPYYMCMCVWGWGRIFSNSRQFVYTNVSS